jgi:hypothetical protein
MTTTNITGMTIMAYLLDEGICYPVTLDIAGVSITLSDETIYPTSAQLNSGEFENSAGGNSGSSIRITDGVFYFYSNVSGSGGDSSTKFSIELSGDNLGYVREIAALKDLMESDNNTPYSYTGDLNIIVG